MDPNYWLGLRGLKGREETPEEREQGDREYREWVAGPALPEIILDEYQFSQMVEGVDDRPLEFPEQAIEPPPEQDRYLESYRGRVAHLLKGYRGGVFPGYYARCELGGFDSHTSETRRRICVYCLKFKQGV